jgi:hypothetical protein
MTAFRFHPAPLNRSKTISKPAPAIARPTVDPEVMLSISPETLNDSCVYVHCYFQNQWSDALVRIWKTTFLVDHSTGAKAGLLHVENISIAPLWTAIPDNHIHAFLLIFAGLPKSCTLFDLIEEIPQPGGFHVQDIPRNQQDVYHIDL